MSIALEVSARYRLKLNNGDEIIATYAGKGIFLDNTRSYSLSDIQAVVRRMPS